MMKQRITTKLLNNQTKYEHDRHNNNTGHLETVFALIHMVYFSTRSTRKKMKTVGNWRVKNNADG